MWRERGPRDLKELRKKPTLCIFNRNRKKIKSEWFLSNILLIYPLFPCEVEGPSSNVLPSIRGECGSLWALPRRIPYPQGDITRAPGLASLNSDPRDWNCSSQHWSVVQREELVTGTFISDPEHLQAVKDTSCQISALHQAGKRILILNYQHTGKHCLWGSCFTVFPVICINNHWLIASPWQKYQVCSHWNSWCLFLLFNLPGAVACIEQKFMNSFY